MIPMPMAPYDGINLFVVHATFAQELVDVFGHVETWYTVLDGGKGGRGMVPPVLPASQVEHDGFAQLLVLDEKSEGGHVHGFMALLYGFNKGFRRDDKISGCVDD